MENQYVLPICLCVRVPACVRVRGAWACACAYVHVAFVIQHAMRMRHIMTLFVAPLAPPHFLLYLNKGDDFRKKVTVLISFITFI
jgi:hypothetical protein